MIKKVIKFIFVGIVVAGLIAMGIYFGFIYWMGYHLFMIRRQEQVLNTPA